MSEVMIPVKGEGTSSDDVTALKSNILQGKTTVTSDSDDEIVEGTMPNCGAKTASLNCGGSYPIPAGYHNGSGKVTANSLASQTGVQNGKTAIVPAAVRSGYEGWVNGSRVTGNMANYTGNTNRKTITPSTAQQTWKIPSGYHDGNGYVTVRAVGVGSSVSIWATYFHAQSAMNARTAYAMKSNGISANGTDGFKILTAGTYFLQICASKYNGVVSTTIWQNSNVLKSSIDWADIDQTLTCAANDIIKISSNARGLSVILLKK